MVETTKITTIKGLNPDDAVRVEERLYSHGARGKSLENCYVFLCLNCKKHEIRGRREQLSSMIGVCKPCARYRWTKRPYEAVYRKLILKGLTRGGKLKDWNVLPFDEFLKLTEIKNCHYCDGNIVWRMFARQNELKDGRGYGYNLDRVDNTGGYERENVVVCCGFCNQLKRNLLTYDDMCLLRDSGLLKTLKERYENRRKVPN